MDSLVIIVGALAGLVSGWVSDGLTVHFGYDAQQRRTSSSVGATEPITETYAYDDGQRTVTVTRGEHDEVHRYDGLGRRSRIEYPDGSQAHFTYTGEGFIEVAEVRVSATGPALSRVTTTLHDALGRPLAWSEADGVATYQASYAGVACFASSASAIRRSKYALFGVRVGSGRVSRRARSAPPVPFPFDPGAPRGAAQSIGIHFAATTATAA